MIYIRRILRVLIFGPLFMPLLPMFWLMGFLMEGYPDGNEFVKFIFIDVIWNGLE